MQVRTVTSVATKKSRDLIKHYNKLEKKGEVVNWDNAFVEIHKLEAKGKMAQISAIMEKKK